MIIYQTQSGKNGKVFNDKMPNGRMQHQTRERNVENLVQSIKNITESI